MAATLAKLTAVLKSQIGYREQGNNLTKYNQWLGRLSGYPHNGYGYPWCASFASWAYAQAGLRAGVDVPRTASCLVGVSWYKQRGRWGNSPKPGAQVFYGPGGGTHTEIVIAVSSSTITTIGGNTSGSLGGTYYNGDGVYQKTIARSNSRIYGYGYPLNLDTSGGTLKEDDTDMPDIYVSLGSTQVRELKPGEWFNLGWDREYGDSANQHGGPGMYPTVLVTPSRYIATVQVAIDGMGPNDAGWIRAAEAEQAKDGSYHYPEFSATETVTGRADGKTVWKHLTWTDWLGKGRRLRIQAGSFTCPVTVRPYSIKIQAWRV